MISFGVRLVSNAVAIWVATYLLAGISLDTDQHDTATAVLVFLGVALVFTVVNLIIKPIVMVLSLPLLILTLGIFYFVVNALMLMFTAWLSQEFGWGFEVEGFGTALLGAIVISIVNMILSVLIPDRR
ncbi:phage holin family protein [Tomitella fengzijianii]|uniref:Phage holin family protein n=1 Tax=Tomitella fengzijianii TaxID=2597660 RepID=A0A516X097_9ACTN|nr:phage holin family protein [Tomitella fengzijianii]QDQ96516.1 phage holin family protein [Tomitella fengzijianii]